VSAVRQSGLDLVIAMLEERKHYKEVLSSANISARDALRTRVTRPSESYSRSSGK
jgi:hypothetical protein